MQCHRCYKENINKANYCRYCGTKFSEEEKEKASYYGIVGILRRIEKWYKATTAYDITQELWFKLSSVIILLVSGIYWTISLGTGIHLLESSLYHVFYQQEQDEYYVFVNGPKEDILEVPLQIYIPNTVDGLKITHYDEDNSVISEEEHGTKSELSLPVNISGNTYYIISDISNNEKPLKIRIYYGE